MTAIPFRCNDNVQDVPRIAPSDGFNASSLQVGSIQKSAETASAHLPNTTIEEVSRNANLPPWHCGQSPNPGEATPPPSAPGTEESRNVHEENAAADMQTIREALQRPPYPWQNETGQ